MNVEEFLESDLVGRRSKIGAFDSEIRQLRARGVSGQGIANFLKLKNVQVTTAVNKYFKRYPDRHPSATPAPSDQIPTGTEGATRPPTVKADALAHVDKPAPRQPAGAPVPITASIGRESTPASQIHESSQHPETSENIGHTHGDGTERGSSTARPDRMSETSKAHENCDVFNSRSGADANYDGGAGLSKSAEAIARSSDQPYRSPLIRFGTSEN
jgi:hypothetical protein